MARLFWRWLLQLAFGLGKATGTPPLLAYFLIVTGFALVCSVSFGDWETFFGLAYLTGALAAWLHWDDFKQPERTNSSE
jgi:hypothetical protein